MGKVIRLDKFLANAGIAPRGKIKLILKENDVTRNGEEVTDIAIKLDPEKDVIAINGEKVVYEKFVYFVLNKPYGVISTTSDELQRENVTEYIDTDRKIFPVGRLDADTTGLLLLTDDGQLAHKLLHPKYHVSKTYKVTINTQIKPIQIKFLEKGVELSDGRTLPAHAKILEQSEEKSIIELTITEGKYHQVKRMFGSMGLEVTTLQRIGFGPLQIGKLKEAESRALTKKEIALLKQTVEK